MSAEKSSAADAPPFGGILELVSAFQRSRVLLTAYELDLFTALGEGERSSAVLFSLNMLVGTAAGDTYTESEVRSWMMGAGLAGIIRKDTEFGTTLIIGRS